MKKMMKCTIAFLMMLSIVGCSSNSKEKENSKKETSTTQVSTRNYSTKDKENLKTTGLTDKQFEIILNDIQQDYKENYLDKNHLKLSDIKLPAITNKDKWILVLDAYRFTYPETRKITVDLKNAYKDFDNETFNNLSEFGKTLKIINSKIQDHEWFNSPDRTREQLNAYEALANFSAKELLDYKYKKIKPQKTLAFIELLITQFTK